MPPETAAGKTTALVKQKERSGSSWFPIPSGIRAWHEKKQHERDLKLACAFLSQEVRCDNPFYKGFNTLTPRSREQMGRVDSLMSAMYAEKVRKNGAPDTAVANNKLYELCSYGDGIKGRFFFHKTCDALLEHGASLMTSATPFINQFSAAAHWTAYGPDSFFKLVLKHGSGKDDALSAALHGAIITGQTDRARTLVAHGAPVDDEHLDNAKNRALTDIVAILQDATDTRREQKFTAAVAAEDDSGNNVLIKPQGRTWRLDTNDCTIYGHKDDLREFIQAQRDIFSLTDRFNTWSGKSPLPEDTVASVWKKIEDAEKKLCDKLAVYHDGTIVENHLPFVRAAFDRETQKTTYLYLIPGSAGGAVQEQARYYRVGLQEGADEELALDRAIQRLPARTP